MMWGNSGMGGWAWVFGILIVIGVMILVVVLIRMLPRPRFAPPQAPGSIPGGASSPKQIVDERYARGELTTEEYRERLAVLGLDS